MKVVIPSDNNCSKMPNSRYRGGKLALGKIKTTPEPTPLPPVDLEVTTTITIENKTFDIAADDLEAICELGNLVYSIFIRVKHF